MILTILNSTIVSVRVHINPASFLYNLWFTRMNGIKLAHCFMTNLVVGLLTFLVFKKVELWRGRSATGCQPSLTL
jgi:hypothetical protein